MAKPDKTLAEFEAEDLGHAIRAGGVDLKALVVRPRAMSDSAACDGCDATGLLNGKPCKHCNGSGRVTAPSK